MSTKTVASKSRNQTAPWPMFPIHSTPKTVFEVVRLASPEKRTDVRMGGIRNCNLTQSSSLHNEISSSARWMLDHLAKSETI
jgi:hypothetical protein